MRLIDRVVAISLVLAGSSAAQAPQLRSIQVSLETGVDHSYPIWINGYLPLYRRPSGGGGPSVRMLDRNDKEVIPETDVSVPDAQHVEVHDVTADQAGNLYATLEAWSPSDGYTGAIYVVGPGGSVIRSFPIGDFLGRAIVVTNSGEIWVFGLPFEERVHKTVTADYPTVKRFAKSGRLIAEYLPRSSFGQTVDPTLGDSFIGRPLVLASGTQVDVYSAMTRRLVELDTLQNKVVHDFTLARPVAADGVTPMACMMLAMTQSSDVFSDCHTVSGPRDRELYVLDKTTGEWVLVDGSGLPSRLLDGSDGDSLILWGNGEFTWAPTTALATEQSRK